MSSLAALRRPFRERHLTHDELIAQCLAWADAFPDLVRLGALATTTEGRTVPLLTIGPEPERRRPSVWVDGNMHANELAGSSVALAIAEDLIALHVDGALPHDLPAHAGDVLRDVIFFIAPRLAPDGAETVIASARYVRSSPRDRRSARLAPRWVTGDVDGDGLALSMRVPDPAGDHVAVGPDGRVMRPREIEDPGPYFRVLPEGHIERFDGRSIPDPHYLADNEVDLNRNFPHAWKAEPEQPGAGGFPTSEPESRGVVEHALAHPEIFAWLNLHCFGGVNIRPPGDKADAKMPIDDLALFRQLEAWAETFTRYPTVSGFEEFTYEPDKPIWGDIVSWAHDTRGAFAWTVELWDLFAEIGLPRPKRFVELYDRWRAEDLERLVVWDRQHNAGRIFGAWRPFVHPQLGPVEVGGVDPRIGIWNPPPDRLDGVCRGQSAVLLRVAAMAPRLVVDVTTSRVSESVTHVEVVAENRGYLPTYILDSARDKPFNEPLWAEVTMTTGARALGASRVALGHLAGWGRGRFNPAQSMFMPQSRGSAHKAFASFTLEGGGEVTLRVGSSRVGFHERTITLGP